MREERLKKQHLIVSKGGKLKSYKPGGIEIFVSILKEGVNV